MKKELIINNIAYSFLYNEDINLWRIVGNENLLLGHKIDLEINLTLLNKDIDWDEISCFISYLQKRSNKINNYTIDKSNIALKGLFNSIFIDSFTEETKSNIKFELSGIDYKKTTVTRLGKQYEYDLFFFPYSTIDKDIDAAPLVWIVKMKGNVLYGTSCDI